MQTVINIFVFVVMLAFLFLMGLMWYKIVRRTGYHPAWGLLMLLPVANIIMLAILAFRQWPIQKQLIGQDNASIQKAESLPFALITVIVLIALVPFFLLLSAIAIPSLLKARLSANETFARETIQEMALVCEEYAKAHNGSYPTDEREVFNQAYNNQTLKGYDYSVRLSLQDYRIVLSPSECGTTGKAVFIKENGQELAQKDCAG